MVIVIENMILHNWIFMEYHHISEGFHRISLANIGIDGHGHYINQLDDKMFRSISWNIIG